MRKTTMTIGAMTLAALSGCETRLDLGTPAVGPDGGEVALFDAGPLDAATASTDAAGSLSGDASVPRAWTWASPEPTPYPPLAVHGLAADDVWIAGEHGMVAHWDGKSSVQIMRVGDAGENLTAIWEAAPNDVWASWATPSGPTGPTTLLHWDGASWQSSFDVWPAYSAGAFWGTGPSDVWTIAHFDDPTPGRISYPLHWDGTQWQAFGGCASCGATSDSTLSFTSLWGSAPNDVWAVGISDLTTPFIAHFDGTAWTSSKASTGSVDPFAAGREYLAIWGSASNDVWAYFQGTQTVGAGTVLSYTGDAGFAHWNGSAWSAELHPGACEEVTYLELLVPPSGKAMWGTGTDSIFASGVGNGCEWNWNGAAWTRVTASLPDEEVSTGVALAPFLVGYPFHDHWGIPGGAMYAMGVTSPGLDTELVQLLGPDPTSAAVIDAQQVFPLESRITSVGSDGTVWSLIDLDPNADQFTTMSTTTHVQFWSGSGWTTVATPASWLAPTYLSARSASDVWTVSDTGESLPAVTGHFDGATWTTLPTPPFASGTLESFQLVAGRGNDAFAVGAVPFEAIGAFAIQPFHWDGSQWTGIPIHNAWIDTAAPIRADLTWFAGMAENVSGGIGSIVVDRWDGAQATEVFRRDPAGQSVQVTGLWSSGDDAVWVSGYPTIHYDGTAWQEIDMTTNGVWGTGPDDVWLIEAPGTVAHWDGSAVTAVKQTDLSLTSISGSDTEVWVSGERGATLRLSATPSAVPR